MTQSSAWTKKDDRQRLYVTEGVILFRRPLKESSVMLDVLSQNLGIIPVIAQGIKKENNKNTGLIEPGNQLELTLYKTGESKWWYYRSGSFIRNFHGDPYANVVIQAAFELIMQMMIEEDDHEIFYSLLLDYLNYVPECNRNVIAIYWRFILAVFRLMGVPLDFSSCAMCEQTGNHLVAYYPRLHGMICGSCYKPAMEGYLIDIDVPTGQLIEKIPIIGNYLDEIEIPANIFRTMNRIVRLHAEENLHKTLRWNALEILEKMLYYA